MNILEQNLIPYRMERGHVVRGVTAQWSELNPTPEGLVYGRNWAKQSPRVKVKVSLFRFQKEDFSGYLWV